MCFLSSVAFGISLTFLMSVIVFTAFNNLFIFFYYSILYKAALRSRMSELGIVVHASMSSLLNYSNFQISLFSCLNKASLERLQVIQSAAVRVQTESLLIQLLQSAL